VNIGAVDGSRPRPAIQTRSPPHTRHLDNRDIEGSAAGTRGLGTVGKLDRNYEKRLVDASDIEGAQAGSKKKGISTLRKTNPLDPAYVWKTEEEKVVQVEKKEKAVERDKAMEKSAARFWGTTPEMSEKGEKGNSQGSDRKSDFDRNANRFYSPESLTQKTMEKDYEKNLQRFFDNKGKQGGNYLQMLEPGSIHRSKKRVAAVDMEGEDYQRNAKKFFFAADSRPLSEASGLSNAGSELKHNAAKFYSTKTPPEGQQRFTTAKQNFFEPGTGQYHFSLSRADIGRPGKKPCNPTEPEFRQNTSKFFGATPAVSSSSHGNLLTAAAKQFFA
jgi:hypothetical protein